MILIDTSAWYALVDVDDINHGSAARRWDELLDDEVLVTHNYVVVETTALVQCRLGTAAAVTLHRSLLPAAELVVVDAVAHHRAVERWAAARARGVSLIDCTSYTVMEARAMTTAFAYDADFASAGFTLVG